MFVLMKAALLHKNVFLNYTIFNKKMKFQTQGPQRICYQISTYSNHTNKYMPVPICPCSQIQIIHKN